MTPQEIADRAVGDAELKAIREQQFEEAARSLELANDHDLHRDADGSYSMMNTRRLFGLFLTGVAIAQAEQDIVNKMVAEHLFK